MDVITIGDALISMNPLTEGPLRFVNTFERKIGGAELNVAIGCSRLGLHTGWITKVGKDEFGRFIINYARSESIDTSHASFVEGFPTSIYFKEIFDEIRINSYYYRDKSPTNEFKVKDIDENYIKQTKILHISGVFPSINQINKHIILHLLKIAKKHNVLVVLDPNIRLKLWNVKEAKDTLLTFLPHVDVIVMGEEESEIMFDSARLDNIIKSVQKYNISHFVLKQGDKGAIGYKDGEIVKSPAFSPSKIVDIIGAGDGFMAGYIYSLIDNKSLEESLYFSNAVASYVISVPGDNEGLPYKEDIDILLGIKGHITR